MIHMAHGVPRRYVCRAPMTAHIVRRTNPSLLFANRTVPLCVPVMKRRLPTTLVPFPGQQVLYVYTYDEPG